MCVFYALVSSIVTHINGVLNVIFNLKVTTENVIAFVKRFYEKLILLDCVVYVYKAYFKFKVLSEN